MAQNKNEKLEKSINYWKGGALKDLEAADSLFEKKLYPQCLFFCHLSIEKLLKGLVIKKTKEAAPFVHDLRRLADIANLELCKDKENVLDDISLFNISGRYPEEKLAFYKKYNESVEKHIFVILNEVKNLFLLWFLLCRRFLDSARNDIFEGFSTLS